MLCFDSTSVILVEILKNRVVTVGKIWTGPFHVADGNAGNMGRSHQSKMARA
jgi:hypothetical protein